MKAEIEVWSDRLAAALFDGGYQGLIVVAIIWAALKMLPRANAATRYAAWLGTLAVVAALPAAHFLRTETTAEIPETLVAEISAEPIEIEPPVSEPIKSTSWALALPRQSTLILVGGWMALALFRLGSLARQVFVLGALKRTAPWAGGPLQASFEAISRDLRLTRGARLLRSPKISVPMVVGFLRPAVLLPEKLAAGPLGIEQLLRHELAHVARWDDWANLLQQAIAAIFFFHPGVWFLSRRLTVEREIACDDHALAALGAPKDYALFLTEFAERARGRDWSAAPAAWSSKSQLKERIGMILDGKRNISPRLARVRVAGMTLTAFLLAFAALQAGPRLALASGEPEAAPVPPAAPAAPRAQIAPEPPAAPLLAVSARVSATPAVAPILVALPSPDAAPAPRPRRDDSVERRLERLEKMVESMMQREKPGKGDLFMGQPRKEDAKAAKEMAKSMDKNREGDWAEIREEVMRERDHAKRDAERAARDAEKAARDVARAHEDIARAHSDMERNRSGADRERQSLKARREALESQRRSIEKQIEALERQMESQEKQLDQEKQKTKPGERQ